VILVDKQARKKKEKATKGTKAPFLSRRNVKRGGPQFGSSSSCWPDAMTPKKKEREKRGALPPRRHRPAITASHPVRQSRAPTTENREIERETEQESEGARWGSERPRFETYAPPSRRPPPSAIGSDSGDHHSRPKSTQTIAEPSLKGGWFRVWVRQRLGGDFRAPANPKPHPKPLNQVLSMEEKWVFLSS